ncbi:protein NONRESPONDING TO OXYLIPINS 2, mitochondrial-like isoform X1 [Nymphaea colorata]|uniref:protein NONRESPONDING TO OXYLIPINS 2, mitochondrial-like isoform X1 n=1 Tax=Nymphaea colorata TaxID=210225 RepID=UPI00129E6DA1|nr:protein NONRESPONDING TO OXYLIPINS 2, mitochondrial-like isoform X1 [Nymphaea colorata]
MASPCRLLRRTTVSAVRSAIRARVSSSPSPCASLPTAGGKATPCSRRLQSFTRLPVELSCGPSLFPLHSAVALARLSSCLSVNSQSCRALSQEIGVAVPR